MKIQEEIRERIEAFIDPEWREDERLTPNEVSFFILKYLDSKDVWVKTQHQWGVLPHEWDTKWERLIDED